MKKQTKASVSQMRGLIIQFLDISNKIETEEWIELIRSIQKEKEKLKRIENLARLGNIFVMLFFLQEILEVVVKEEPP